MDELDDDIAGIVVLKDGATMHEAYDNGCDETMVIHGYSVMKSIVSMLFGIALDAGCFNREKGLVVAIASLFELWAKDRIDLIRTRIEPAFA